MLDIDGRVRLGEYGLPQRPSMQQGLIGKQCIAGMYYYTYLCLRGCPHIDHYTNYSIHKGVS